MTICLFVCLFCLFVASHKYYWLDLSEKKSQDESCSKLDPIKF